MKFKKRLFHKMLIFKRAWQSIKVTPHPCPALILLHLLCFISNAVPERPVDKSQNFDGVAYIA